MNNQPLNHSKRSHERIRPLGWLRGRLRGMFFRLLARAVITDDGKTILVNGLRGLLRSDFSDLQKESLLGPAPYPGIGQPNLATRPARRDDVVFITARFRSGSTLLWNLFRHIPGCTAYYEPFNERRWFDPARRGTHTDSTHRGVEKYWQEYDGLEILKEYYREEWIDQSLFMDESSWNPAMKRYVELLIGHAPSRPVLQFNRIDFRLPWFRRHFPRARFVHLYRHPRDQWCSALLRHETFPKENGFTEFGSHDHFYLRNWARDLRYRFPFLEERDCVHPYRMHYYLWKLSYLFGRRYAHESICFEDLVLRPEDILFPFLNKLGIHDFDPGRLKGLLVRPDLEKWRTYASEAWFQEHEGACETVLAEYFGVLATPQTSMHGMNSEGAKNGGLRQWVPAGMDNGPA
jgi:hypothetical protein